MKKTSDTRQKVGPIGCELFDKLKAFYNDKEFVLGVMTFAETEDGWQKVIDFMNSNDNLKPSDIVTFTRKLQK